MKGFVFSLAGLGVGGAALFAGADSPDFDRTIKRSPAAVYAAFSALGDEGESPADPIGFAGQVTHRIDKVRNESIRYELRFDGHPVVEIDLAFEPVDEGRSTRMTAEIDLDKRQLGQLIEIDAGMAMTLVPDSFFDQRFAEMLEHMVQDVEEGRSPSWMGMGQSGMQWRHNSQASVAARQAQAESARRQAAAPMVRPEPMVDPNQAARDYLNGR